MTASGSLSSINSKNTAEIAKPYKKLWKSRELSIQDRVLNAAATYLSRPAFVITVERPRISRAFCRRCFNDRQLNWISRREYRLAGLRGFPLAKRFAMHQ